MAGGIPTGTVTFYFSDVEASTRLWEEHPVEMRLALARHDEILHACIGRHDGYVFSLAGDQFVAAFHNVEQAVNAATDTQGEVAREPWPTSTPIKVRIGIHVGVPEERDNDYFGQVLNRTARIASAGHGGQTILSDAAAVLIRGADLFDLGAHRLKDLAEAEHLWQVGRDVYPALRTMQAFRHNLPVERTPLVGRSDDITEISKTVLDHRLVTLLGIGGTGKTRLALAVAAEIAERFEDGTWFVDLVAASDVTSVVESIARAVGLRLTGGNLLDALVEQAERRHLLLILDNCEHVTDDIADVVDRLLERADSVHVIATSREPLDLPDEHQHRVAPLAVSASISSPAVRLFTSTAGRLGIELGSGDAVAIADICSHLDGLPLSIELAAAQLRQLSLEELSDRLDQRFELLTRSRVNRRRRRQMSLHDVLDDSWKMLDGHEQELLRAIAAFPSSFSLRDAEALTGDSRSTGRNLGGLADRGLIASDGRSRSRLLETVKLFARSRWNDEGDTSDPGPQAGRHLERHTDWVLAQLQQDDADTHQSVALAGWAIQHYDDHRAAEDRLAAAGRFDELTTMLDDLRWAYSRESTQRSAFLIERIERYLADEELTDRQAALLHLVGGRAARSARDADWIRGGGRRAVELFRQFGPSTNLASALIAATYDAIVRHPPDAFVLLDEAYAIAEEIGSRTLMGATLAYRANYAMMTGAADEVPELLARLQPFLDRSRPDNTLVMTLEATLMANLIENPASARAAIEECVSVMSLHGMDTDWFLLLYLAVGTATTGDITATSGHLAHIDRLLVTSGIDGLPDLLLPYLALAHALGDDDRCQRWLTAIRHDPGDLGTGISIAAYRLHRSVVGLAQTNPLDESSIDDILDEARSWVTDLPAT